MTTFAYDSFGQVTSVVDPLSNSTLYTYNKLGQLVTENKPVNGVNKTRSYSYDGEGNLRSLLDRNGRTTEWGYDNRQRVTTETWKTGATVNRTLAYGYDTLDRTTSLTDSDVLATDFEFAYDARSQLQAERQLTGLVGTSVVLDREFDGDGNRTWLTTNFGGTLSGTNVAGGIRDSVVNFGYDAMNRLWAISQSTASQGASNGVNTVAPKSAFFQFDAASQVTDLRRYSATTNSSANLEVHSRYGYDSAGRVTNITHGKTEIAAGEMWNGTSTLPASLGSTNMLAGYFLTYDADNRVTSLASQRDAFKTTYTYNMTDQLTAASSAVITGMTLPFSAPTSESYNLDANGNRKTSGGVSQSASGTQNQLQTDGTYNYTYDNEGNVTRRTLIASGAVTDYTWDHRNRLVTVTEKTSATGTTTKKTEYVYDAFDQRVAKRHDADGNGTWDKYEAFVWADGHEVLRFLDSDGQGTGQVFRVADRYLYADAVDQLISDEQYTNNTGPAVSATTGSATAGNTLWALADQLGSVRDVVDNNGVVRQHVVFDSFGNRKLEVDYDASGTQIASTNAAAIDELFGYTGRDWDSDVGLQYNRARWYDPATGRWLSQDPIGFAAGDANLYRYVGNHPTLSVDPSGLAEGWPSMPFGIPIILTGGSIHKSQMHAVHSQQETITVWKNTAHMDMPARIYVTAGTTIATEVGVRGLSDAFSPDDAVDAHKQSILERSFDGVTGGIQLFTTACGVKGVAPRVPIAWKHAGALRELTELKPWVLINDSIENRKRLTDLYFEMLKEFDEAGGKITKLKTTKGVGGEFHWVDEYEVRLYRNRSTGTSFEELYHFKQIKTLRELGYTDKQISQMREFLEDKASEWMKKQGFGRLTYGEACELGS